MSGACDLDVFKDIPGYKAILKSVIKTQIQMLVEQLAEHTEEESIILTASVNDGTLTHLGSGTGKGFLEGRDEIKSQFLGYCLKSHHKKTSEEALSHSPYTGNNASRLASGQRSAPKPSAPKRARIHPVSLTRVTPSADDNSSLVGEPVVGPGNSAYDTSLTKFKRKSSGAIPKSTIDSSVGEISGAGDNLIKSVKLEYPSEDGQNNSFDNFLSDTSTPVTYPQSLQLAHTQTSTDAYSVSQQNPGTTDDANSDTVPDIKVEPVTESELELEITGIEMGTGSHMTQTDLDQSMSGDQMGYDSSAAEGNDSMNQSGDNSGYKQEMDGGLCPQCGKAFSNKRNLEQHLRRHAGKGNYTCCGKIYFSKGELSRHWCNRHGAVKTHICATCSKAFATRKDLKRHMSREMRTMSKKCPQCDFAATDVANLKDHMSMHSSDKRHCCKYCRKRYRYQSGLCRHLKINHTSK